MANIPLNVQPTIYLLINPLMGQLGCSHLLPVMNSTSPSYLVRNRTLGLPLENNPEIPASSRDEGLRLLHGLETNLRPLSKRLRRLDSLESTQ